MKLNNIAAAIIAGGKSERFGSDKLLFFYGGKPLIGHVLDALKDIFDEIMIISNDINKFSDFNFPSHPDMPSGSGPLAGIYSALLNAKANKVFCFAGDMPFLNGNLIRYMCTESAGYDVTVPCKDEYYETLHAVYSKDCAKYIEANIAEGNFRITGFYGHCSVRKIDYGEVGLFAAPETAFKNINYFKDLKGS